MRRLWPLLLPPLFLIIPPLLLIWGSHFASGASDGAANGVNLRVTVEGDNLRSVPAHIPTFSRIELLNTHPTDPIKILSLQTIEHNGKGQFFDVGEETLPQSLPPGQSTFIPLIFLPRGENPDHSASDNERDGLVRHLVTVQVTTSRGTASTVFRATSTIQSPYGIHAGLRFMGYVDDEEWDRHVADNDSHFRQDIYLRNPSQKEELRVVEIFPTEPDWIRIEYEPPMKQSGVLQSGPLSIPPMGFMYIGSVHIDYSMSLPASFNENIRAINETTTATVSWGYIHIRTNMDNLILPVEIVVGRRGKLAQIKNSAPGQPSLPSDRGTRDDTAKLTGIETEGKDSTNVDEKVSQKVRNNINILEAIPPIADFGVLTDEDEFRASNKSLAINVANHGDSPVRIVEVTVRPFSADNASALLTENGDIFDTKELHRIIMHQTALLTSSPRTSQDSDTITSVRNPNGIIVPAHGVVRPAMMLKCSTFITPEAAVAAKKVAQRHWGIIAVQAIYTDDPETVVSLDIPYVATVILGRIGFDPESLSFPEFSRSESPLVEPSRGRRNKKGNVHKIIKRDLHFTNHFPVTLTLLSIDLEGCNDRFELIGVDSAVGTAAHSGKKWNSITMKYTYGRDTEETEGITDHGGRSHPLSSCSLILRTNINLNQIPITVYNGFLIVTAQDEALPSICRSNLSLIPDIDNRKCTEEWWESSPSYKRFCTIHKKVCEERSKVSLLRSNELGLQSKTIRPIVLSFGAIGAGEVETRSLYLTNLNPVPVTVNAVVSSLEGMQVMLGRVASNMLEYLPNASHLDKNSSALQFLNQGQSFFPELCWKNDISPSEHASAELQNLYKKHAVIEFFRESGRSSVEFLSDLSLFDAPLLNTESKPKCKGECGSEAKGYLRSFDGNEYVLNSVETKSQQKQWSIPPGAVARFDVHIRSPLERMLKQDITSFVASGLELSTEAEHIPIVVTYEALLGQLRFTPVLLDDMSNISGEELNGDVYNFTTSAFDEHDWKELNILQRRSVNHNKTSSVPFLPLDVSQQTKLTVPITFRPISRYKEAILNPSRDSHNVPLFLESTFSNDFILYGIESCNKWFTVVKSEDRFEEDLTDESFQHSESSDMTIKARSGAVQVGHLFSTASCSQGDNFFACALEWLESRETIQPLGCGELLNSITIGSREKEAKSRALSAMKRVVSHLTSRYGPSADTPETISGKMSTPEFDMSSELRDEEVIMDKLSFGTTKLYYQIPGFQGSAAVPSTPIANTAKAMNDTEKYSLLSGTTVKKFEAAIDAWNQISEMGFNKVSTNVRAKTNYMETSLPQHLPGSKASPNNDKKPVGSPLMIAGPDLLVEAEMKIPRLHESLDEVLNFDTTHIASISEKYIFVTNPTAFNIKVKLSGDERSDQYVTSSSGDNSELFVQLSPSDTHAWWTGGSYWMADQGGNLIQSNHNVTIKSSGGAHVSLVNPSLHGNSAFIRGCGKRCGLRNEVSSTDKMQSVIGASASMGVNLVGNSMATKIPPAYAIALRGLEEIDIPPFGDAMLGPIYFRPPRRGLFQSTLYLENSFNGLEKVILKGNGGWEKLVFLEDDAHEDSSEEYGSIELRMGLPTLVFPGSAGPRGTPVTKSFVVANQGDFTIDVSNVYVGTGETLYFTNIKPHPTKKTLKDMELRRSSCEERGFYLLGCTAKPDSRKMGLAFGGGIISYLLSRFDSFSTSFSSFDSDADNSNTASATRALNEHGNLRHGFILLPGENKTIYIQHNADCTFRNMYASLNFEYRGRNVNGRWDKEFKRHRSQLLVGYDMNRKEMKTCAPSFLKPNVFGKSYLPGGHLKLKSSSILSSLHTSHKPLIICFFLWFLFCNFYWFFYRHKTATRFRTMLMCAETTLQQQDLIDCSGHATNWSVFFRCLARSDPTNVDLAYQGKEQTKQILLSKYRKLDILPPSCIQTNGEFVREYPHAYTGGNTNGSNIVSGGEKQAGATSNGVLRRTTSNGGNHFLTMTDAIFNGYLESKGDSNWHVSIGLGWRFAVNKKVIQSVDGVNFGDAGTDGNHFDGSYVKELLHRRANEKAVVLSDESLLSLLVDENTSQHYVLVSDTEIPDIQSDSDTLLNEDLPALPAERTKSNYKPILDSVDSSTAHNSKEGISQDYEKQPVPKKEVFKEEKVTVKNSKESVPIELKKSSKQRKTLTPLGSNESSTRYTKAAREKVNVIDYSSNATLKNDKFVHRGSKIGKNGGSNTSARHTSKYGAAIQKSTGQYHNVTSHTKVSSFGFESNANTNKKSNTPSPGSIGQKLINEISSHHLGSPRSSTSSATSASRLSSLSADSDVMLASPPLSPSVLSESPRKKYANKSKASKNSLSNILPPLPIEPDDRRNTKNSATLYATSSSFQETTDVLPTKLRRHNSLPQANPRLIENADPLSSGIVRPPPGLPPPPGFREETELFTKSIENKLAEDVSNGITSHLVNGEDSSDDLSVLPPTEEISKTPDKDYFFPLQSAQLMPQLTPLKDSSDGISKEGGEIFSQLHDLLSEGEAFAGKDLSPFVADPNPNPNPFLTAPTPDVQGNISAIGSGFSGNINTDMGTELRLSGGSSDYALNFEPDGSLLGFGVGFNVENFLDSLLDETGPVEVDEKDERARWDSSSGDLLSATSNERNSESRAIAYGIAVGGPLIGGERSSLSTSAFPLSSNGLQSQNEDGVISPSLENAPLLTQAVPVECDEDDFINVDAFLASIVGEE